MTKSSQRKKNRLGKVIGRTLDFFFSGLSNLSKYTPLANMERFGIEVLDNIAYGDLGSDTTLDIYRPKNIPKKQKLPVVMYIHGGAFCTMSKDTHWVMGRNFGRAGYIVVNINYRLAPQNPYPAGLQDVCTAWKWVYENIATYGGDIDQIVVAGESAGANLALALALVCSMKRSEPWAKEIYQLQHRPKAIVPMCGIFEVRRAERFLRPYNPLRFLVYRNILDIQYKYIPPEKEDVDDIIDPLCLVENLGNDVLKSLPPTFLSVGTWDPLLEDTQRLYAAMKQKGHTVEVRYYKREVHAFQALLFRKQARMFWKEMLLFLKEYVEEQSN